MAYRSLAATGDGRLILGTEAGEYFVYRPDRGPGPQARLVGAAADGRVDGRADSVTTATGSTRIPTEGSTPSGTTKALSAGSVR